jgi:hypothetical protein
MSGYIDGSHSNIPCLVRDPAGGDTPPVGAWLLMAEIWEKRKKYTKMATTPTR